MIEVPISMALIVVMLMIGLALFAFVVMVRFISKRLTGDPGARPVTRTENNRELSSQPPAAVEKSNLEEMAVEAILPASVVKPVLILGISQNTSEKQVWKAEEPPCQLKRGLLSRADEALLSDGLALLKSVMGVDETKPEVVAAPMPVFPVVGQESKPRKSMIDLLGREKPVVDKPISMANQMNDFLQDMLRNLPGETKNMRIEDGPNGDLRIWLNSRVYNSLDELPDPQARELIRKAAEAWIAKNAASR